MPPYSWRTVLGRLSAGALALGLVCDPAGAGGASGPLWRALGGTTTIRFNPDILADLGIVIAGTEASGMPRKAGDLRFEASDTSDLVFDAPGGDLEALGRGELRHRGGFALALEDGPLSLLGFRLRVAPAPAVFDLLDAEGRRWFVLHHAHPLLRPERQELLLLNMDLILAPELALRLGRPELTGLFAGAVEVVVRVEAPVGFVPAGACVDNFDLDTDVELTDIGGVSQLAREAGVRVAIAPSASLRNAGEAAVEWFAAIEPDAPPALVGPHPFLALHFYRIADGAIEQIGRADAKHAFFATNTGCDCPPGNILYPGCNDSYGTTTNADRFHLGPRAELTASSGAWERVGSHFDAVPVDDFRDHGGNSEHDSFEHRLVVAEPDLETPGARYFIEAWYIAAGDIDLFNGIGRREVTPTLSGNIWTFPFADTSLSLGAAIDAWVDPTAPPAGTANTRLDTGEGHIQLAVRTEDLGGGLQHYQYALMNLDFDRQIASFSVPIPPGVAVTNAGFGDVDADGGNDWTVTIGPDTVSWQAPSGNALDWGTLFNFRFDADAAPGDATAVLGVLEPGDPATLDAATLAPEAPGLVLAASGACPGTVTASVSGATPNRRVTIFSAPSEGSDTVPGGPCAGTPLGLANPTVFARLTADASGQASIDRTLPGAVCTRVLQALDLASCRTSDVVPLP